MTPGLLAILALYGVLLAGAGLWVSSSVRRAEDFFVAGRRLGPGLLAATVLAANIGSGSTVGATGLAYGIGASAWWWVGSAALGTFVLAFWVGPRIWRVARRLDAYTVGDYLEARFGRLVRTLVMAVLWLGSIAILMVQIVAIGRVLEAAADLHLNVGIVLGALIVLAYYGSGGLWSSSVVNVIELSVKLVAFPVAVVVLARLVGGIPAIEALGEGLPSGAAYLSPVGVGWAGIVGYLGVLGTSFVISPGLLQKAFGARDESAVRLGLAVSGIGLLAFAFAPTLLGMLARVRWPVPTGVDPTNFDWVLPRLMVDVLPPWIGLLLLAAVVSAELSSADAVLFMLSTSMSRDFYQAFWNPGVDDRGLLRAGRTAAVVGLGLGVVLALFLPSVLQGLNIFYGLMVIALAVPLVAGLYVPAAGNAAALAGMGTSVAVALATLWRTGGPGATNFWPYLLGVLAGAVTCAAVTLIAPVDRQDLEKDPAMVP